MDELFDGLNAQQLNAVIATEGNVRIIAGAGSGKTKTLTHRFGYLVLAAGIQPGNILCVTFTNKAAREMKKRVRKLIGDGCDSSLITTYHGFCVRVLRDDIYRLMYPKTFSILNETEQRRILAEIYGELDLKMDKATFENVMNAVHRLKSDEKYVDLMINNDVEYIVVPPADSNTPVNPFEVDVIKRYLKKQKKLFALDFDDLIAFTFTIFGRYPEVRDKWSEQLYYIQVDEFQDSSKRELRLIQALCANHQNLFVVGDPDQNIYEWRGADMAILVDFDKIFPGTQTIMLNQNYRSTGNILKAANTLIAHNKNRIPKDLYTIGESGANVIHLHAKSEYEEGRWIAREIKRLVRDEGIEYRDIAILYRASFLSRFIEQALMGAAVPYEIYGSVRFYERMEIRDVLAYLKLVMYDDDDAFERIINTPRRNFGKARLNALKNLAENENTSLYSTLKMHQNEVKFHHADIEQFILLIENLRQLKDELPVSELLQKVITESGYEKYIRELGSTERLDNLAECKRAIWEREQSYGEYYSLNIYLQEVALESHYELEENLDKVKLMTIHASKGLEFPACFVCGMTEGIFPSGRTIEERAEDGLEEERRLCFVALTRAMKYLYLTESEGDSENNAHKRPSRFLFDIGENNYRRIGIIPKDLMESSVPFKSRSKQPVRAIGDSVQHPIFGKGTITKIDMIRRIYDIDFEKGRRPVSIDYDFDAWQNLIKRQEQAREMIAGRERVPATSVKVVHKALPERVESNSKQILESQSNPYDNQTTIDTPKLIRDENIARFSTEENDFEEILRKAKQDLVDLKNNPHKWIDEAEKTFKKICDGTAQLGTYDELEAKLRTMSIDTPCATMVPFEKDTQTESILHVPKQNEDQSRLIGEHLDDENRDEEAFDSEWELSDEERNLLFMDVTKDKFLQFLDDCVDDDDEEIDDDKDEENVDDRLKQRINPSLDSKVPAMRLSTAGIPKVKVNRFEHEEWAQPFVGTENLWLRKDVPHHGWECVAVIDLGAPVGICRMCGKQIIRYVHVMKHPNYYRTIGAGCVCAGKMQQDIAKAREREKQFKAWENRRANFVKRYTQRYLEHPVQNMRLDERSELKIVIHTIPGGYCYTENTGFEASQVYSTLEEILMAIYDIIIDPWKVIL